MREDPTKYNNHYENYQRQCVSEEDLLNAINYVRLNHICNCNAQTKPDNCVSYKNVDHWCEDRATLMQQFFEAQKIVLKKIFVSGCLFHGSSQNDDKFWYYHAALLAYVKKDDSDECYKKVIDFSFPNVIQPMSIRDWLKLMTVSCNKKGRQEIPKTYYLCVIASKVYTTIYTDAKEYSHCDYFEYKPDSKFPHLTAEPDPLGRIPSFKENGNIC